MAFMRSRVQLPSAPPIILVTYTISLRAFNFIATLFADKAAPFFNPGEGADGDTCLLIANVGVEQDQGLMISVSPRVPGECEIHIPPNAGDRCTLMETDIVHEILGQPDLVASRQRLEKYTRDLNKITPLSTDSSTFTCEVLPP